MYNITLIPGDGIGPEVSEAAKHVVDATGLNINWETVNAGEKVFQDTGVLVPEKVFQSIEKNKIVLKGPITTPIGSGFRSINVMLRKKYDLYSNVRPVRSLPGINTPFKGIDLVIFRENTEGLYAGIEQELPDGSCEAVKRVSRNASIRIAEAAFEYAKKNNKKKVTVAHKANIMKLADGLFLNCVREVSQAYPDIALQEVIVDNMCMQLVMNPNQFEVIVTMNLYGDLLSDLCAGLVGGLGLVPGANIGKDISIFEAVHGSAPDIAGKNLANPIALILSSAMMLNHMGETDKAEAIIKAVTKTIYEDKVLTCDLGGKATTNEITKAIIKNII
ncbi:MULTISPECIES: isocitrate/isopropylmalate dehydrogenase family protein [Psychrilyobacter]|uniref:Isocitrate/isopropylmalate dehydrogenase family protein n=1 Tax=Psychrilyobacter piezotolerans TaxID=2293438 RepID=A0ABX9KEA4_9FUSO|nr:MULTISPECIES: isocitrate/isopropylmalate dehydrogenase family protein [Psychrilyobacter]MCS5422518.1 isocitrate/isopropylmalate dehydrogenase family protein [Psychrilyobacter sp. S5]NDI78742.1 isocitrate/isopropylmalate dehydrogenase family protein [Psychrilyobacter piezotolerans]RDE59590.1 isocitrate/isopropylmalate dehydrogenase family protein [Psychrilyobacter sp. S5]REI40004.1 isocitrate/isopropylmalate dehydrogenase family protein [Psychrilyobacter piezotolerans]